MSLFKPLFCIFLRRCSLFFSPVEYSWHPCVCNYQPQSCTMPRFVTPPKFNMGPEKYRLVFCRRFSFFEGPSSGSFCSFCGGVSVIYCCCPWSTKTPQLLGSKNWWRFKKRRWGWPNGQAQMQQDAKKKKHLFFFPVVFWKLNMGLFKCVRVNLVGR